MSPDAAEPGSGRRSFFKQALAIGIGAFSTIVPVTAGLVTFFHPLRRGVQSSGTTVRVTTLDALPNDGIPRRFPVIASRTDAWNKYAEVPVGAVYLRRTGEDQIHALNVVCPHAGCFVNYRQDHGSFLCPCHASEFTLDGAVGNRDSPSPRGLDALEVEIRNGREVWVRFQNFQAGTAEKTPLS